VIKAASSYFGIDQKFKKALVILVKALLRLECFNNGIFGLKNFRSSAKKFKFFFGTRPKD
jgi:hypothetical protein